MNDRRWEVLEVDVGYAYVLDKNRNCWIAYDYTWSMIAKYNEIFEGLQTV